MTTISDPTETPEPIGPDIDPGPSEAPYPEIMPDSSPSEAPMSPSFPDDGRPYDTQTMTVTSATFA